MNTSKLEKIWASSFITIILYVLVCLTWGTTWIGIQIAVETIPPLLASGLRFMIAFPFLFLITCLAKAPIFFPKDQSLLFILLILFYFTIPYFLISYGEQYVSSGLTSLLFSTMPIFSIIFSIVLLKENIILNQIIGITIGFFCLVLILHSEGMMLTYSGFLGVVAILLAAIMHGFLYVYSKKNASEINIFTFNTLPIGISGFLLCLCSILFESINLNNVTLHSWVALIYLGIVATVGGFIIYFYLLRRMSPIILSFIFIIFPVIAIVIDAQYQNKEITSSFIFYSIIMLLGFLFTKVPLHKIFIRK